MLHFIHKQHLPEIHWENTKKQKDTKWKRIQFFLALKAWGQSYMCKVNFTIGSISSALTLYSPFYFNGYCLCFILSGFTVPYINVAPTSKPKCPRLIIGDHFCPQTADCTALVPCNDWTSFLHQTGQALVVFSWLRRGVQYILGNIKYPR